MPKIFVGEFENAKLIYLCIAECAVLSTLCSRIPFVGFSPFRIMFPYFLNVGRVHFCPVSLGQQRRRGRRLEKQAEQRILTSPSLVVLDVPFFPLADLSIQRNIAITRAKRAKTISNPKIQKKKKKKEQEKNQMEKNKTTRLPTCG